MVRVMNFARREIIVGIAAMLSWLRTGHARGLPKISVSKDPNCGCCGEWVAHLRAAGFEVEVSDTTELSRVKARLGVPSELSACHTAQVAGYVIEGHVPAPVIRRLLVENPQASGLAVPGMPTGSPGMEVEGSPPDEYAVVLFGPGLRRTYARFRGATEIGR